MSRPWAVRSYGMGLVWIATVVGSDGARGVEWATAVPSQAVVMAEVFNIKAVLEPLLSEEFSRRVEDLPVYRAGQGSGQNQELRNLAQLVEGVAGSDWRTVARRLMSGGMVMALGPGGERLLGLEGEDGALLEKLHGTAVQIAESEAGKRGATGVVRSAEYSGAKGWTFNGREAHAILGKRLWVADGEKALRAVLDLRAGDGVGSVARQPGYREARQAVGEGAAAMIYVDLERLRQAPGWTKAMAGMRQNPLGVLLLADVVEGLARSAWLGLGVYPEADGVRFRLFWEGGGSGLGKRVSFVQAGAGEEGPWKNLVVPRQIAAVTLHRDLAAFYGAKDDLFPDRTSGLIFFENMMGIFFSGRSLTDEVLAGMHPQVRLVVARQTYDEGVGTPEPQLPAFALVLRLRDPAAFGEVLEEAWQKALGLVNFTQGQKALPGLILDRPRHAGTAMTVSAYSARGVKDRAHLDPRFNFRPTLVLVHGHAILSSTDQLARDLMDALPQANGPIPGAERAAHSWMQVGGKEFAAILRENRAVLIRGNMVKEGKSEAAAAQGIDTLLAVVGWFDRATLTMGGGGANEAAALEFRMAH